MSKKKKQVLFTFPAAKGIHVALKRPDTKYNEHGTYKANVRLSEADAAPVMAQLQEMAQEATGKKLPKKKNKLWYYEVDKETEDETGFVIFRNEVKNRINKKDGKLWERRPMLLDADCEPVDANPWGGSTLIVQSEFYVGKDADGKPSVSLQPIVVQIVELVTGTGSGKGDMSAFKKHDSGFKKADAADEADEDDEDEDDDYGSSGNSNSDDGDADY